MYPLIAWKVVFGGCWLSPVSQKEGAAPKTLCSIDLATASFEMCWLQW